MAILYGKVNTMNVFDSVCHSLPILVLFLVCLDYDELPNEKVEQKTERLSNFHIIPVSDCL